MPSCLIVGANRGIGREFVKQYLADGWQVHATARSEDDVASLTDAGATGYQGDVSDEQSLKALASNLPDGLDLIVHNAGVGSKSAEGPASDIDPEDWERVMRINALGPVLGARQLLPKLQRPGGTWAVLTSLMGSIADNGFGGYWSYRMSKTALNMAVKNLALANEDDGVGIIALHPGHVATDMGGSSAPVKPEESVSGLRQVIADKSPKDGRLFVDYRGKRLDW